MTTRNVDILLRAKDQASKKFNTLSKASGGLTRSLKKLAIAGAAFVGGRALFRLGKQAIEFAALQQESDALLVQTLKNAGDIRSAALLPALKSYASELQRVTKFSNEEAEATILLGLSMGITTSKIAEATKQSIGLNAITGGKLGLADSMKGLANANVGVFTSLERYIPELRTTKDETEKLAILNRKAADGFELAKVAATQGLGPLVQMKNALDDMAKSIARPFLPAVQKAQLAVKKWAENNEEKFASWSAAAALHIGKAKDTFLGFVDFMKNDFTNSMVVVWDSFLILLKAAMDSAIILAGEGGRNAGNAFRAGLIGNEPTTTAQIEAFKKAGGKTFTLGQAAKTVDPGPLSPVGGDVRGLSVRSRAFRDDPSIRRQRSGPTPQDNVILNKIERGIAELVREAKDANSRIPGQGRLNLKLI